MQVKPKSAHSILAKLLQARLVPMLIGSPGCGKSQIVHQVAKDYNLKVIDMRLAQCEPTDLLGLPRFHDNRAGYVPMDTFPIEGDTVPAGYNGWLLFLDEMNSAKDAVQAAAYKLILDRMVGSFNLHKNVAIICAGNLETDNAIVQSMSTALESRLVHIELLTDAKQWVDWAADNGIDHRITAHINFKPGNLFTFQPDHTDHTFACPRTWEFAHKILQVTQDGDPERLAMLSGALGEGVAREFLNFMKVCADLPRISDILRNPTGMVVPVEPSILFALTGSIAHHADDQSIGDLLKYIDRLPVEFRIVCVRETVRRNKSLLQTAALARWVSSTSVALFD